SNSSETSGDDRSGWRRKYSVLLRSLLSSTDTADSSPVSPGASSSEVDAGPFAHPIDSASSEDMTAIPRAKARDMQELLGPSGVGVPSRKEARAPRNGPSKRPTGVDSEHLNAGRRP